MRHHNMQVEVSEEVAEFLAAQDAKVARKIRYNITRCTNGFGKHQLPADLLEKYTDSNPPFFAIRTIYNKLCCRLFFGNKRDLICIGHAMIKKSQKLPFHERKLAEDRVKKFLDTII